MTAFPLDHDCATELWRLRQRDEGETHDCGCGRLWTLRPLTLRRLMLRQCRPAEGWGVWVRNRRQERADRREQTLRRREWNRG